jgi:imidazolonepropionase-like amidohydrolase
MAPPFLLAAALAATAAHPDCRVASPGADDRPAVVIEDVAVVDVARGVSVGPRTVLIDHGFVVAVDLPGSAAIPRNARRLDGTGRFLIPGLVDMHVHLFNNSTRRPPNDWAFPLFVANGVTAVRDMNTEPGAMTLVERWRTDVARGALVAPRVIATGVALGDDTAEAVPHRVREARAAGIDFVKTYTELGEPAWRAALDAARASGMRVHGHVPGAVGLVAAARDGQAGAEHLMQAYEACTTDEARWLGPRRGLHGAPLVALRDAQEGAVLDAFDAGGCARVAVELAGLRFVQTPTLVLPHVEARGDHLHYRDDPHWSLLRPDEQARWERILPGLAAADASLAALRLDVSRRIVGMLHAAGAPLLAGTDAPMPLVYPGYSLHQELALLVESGLAPAAALRAATLGPAELLGMEPCSGSVAAGKRADLVLLDGDPLADIRNTQRIRAVVLGGRVFERTELDALLTPAAARED